MSSSGQIQFLAEQAPHGPGDVCVALQSGEAGRARGDMDHWRHGDGWHDSVTVFTDEVDTDLEQRAIIIT